MRYLLFLFVFISSTTLAQNGINYQGAATDSEGAKLVDQNISLRTSILQGGVDGNTSYSETHNTTTDQFGLFNVVIGQGEVVSGDFEGISWGADAHFLKVELDATGGSDYSLVSTTQMMSVPYALYAENAAVDSTSLADMLASMNFSNYNGGCDFNFPLGISNEFITGEIYDYTVPNGKILFVTQIQMYNTAEFRINDILIASGNYNSYHGGTLHAPIIVDENENISGNGVFNGFLIDKSNIQPLTQPIQYYEYINGNYQQFGEESYTVPNGKILIITQAFRRIVVNNLIMGEYMNRYNNSQLSNFGIPLILKEGDIITSDNEDNQQNTINGYLVDEDYFENCVGGGGSVSSTPSGVDSAMVADMIATIGGVASAFGEFITINSSIENQATEDGFLFGNYYCGGPSNSYFKIYCDTFTGNETQRAYIQSNPYGGNFDRHDVFMIPIKKGEYYSFDIGGYSYISDSYFIPLIGSGNNSIVNESTDLDSAMVAEMISSALAAQGNSSIPTGTVQAFAGETIPDGWMLCDGSAISRTDYDDLFEVIGEKYGTGDGTFTMEWSDTNGDGSMQQDEFTNIPSTFNIPDLRGRVIIGPDNMGGNNAGVVQDLNDIGVTGGSETHTLTEAEMPSHEHDLWPVTTGGATGFSGISGTNSGSWSFNDFGTFLSQQAGGDQPHNNMQPYISINYIIKL